MPDNSAPLPDFTRWPSFPFEGDMRVKDLAAPVAVEPPRSGEDAAECVACNTPDDAYIWFSERWRVRAMDRPTGLPIVLILECRSHLDLGDLPNLLAAELGVMTVRLERAIRSLDDVARVHVNRWGDGSAHLHMWFLARPYGRLQLRGTFLSLWDDILPTIPEVQWRENMSLVAAWLADFGGEANVGPAHIQWESPSTFSVSPTAEAPETKIASTSSAPAASIGVARVPTPGAIDDLTDDVSGASTVDPAAPSDSVEDLSNADSESVSAWAQQSASGGTSENDEGPAADAQHGSASDKPAPVAAADPSTGSEDSHSSDGLDGDNEDEPPTSGVAVPRQATGEAAEPRMTAR